VSATTTLRRLRDVALTVLGLAVVIPVLVVLGAVAGLAPRHWSGVSLSALDIPFADLSPYHGGSRPPVMDDVTDALIAMQPDSGWVRTIGDGDGRVYVATTRLGNNMFVDLGNRFGGGTVGVIYAPMDQRPALYEPGFESADDASAWQRTDPVSTWITLLFGFPVALGVGVVLAALGWTALLLRRRRRTRYDAGS
jgi:hypothetical protein